MFYDERIEYEKGRISRNCIIISVIGALIYGSINLANMLLFFESPGIRQFFHLAIEAAIIISGSICLAMGFFKVCRAKDERTVSERNIFYSKAAAIHLCIAALLWAWNMPFAAAYPLPSINFAALPYHYILILLFCPIVAYCVYSFKKHEIYFNYSILESGHYYKSVFKNLLKFAKYLLCLMGVSFAGLFAVLLLNMKRADPVFFLVSALSILVTYVCVFITASVLYLLLSALEKSSYDNETHLFSKATVISFISATLLTLLNLFLAFAASDIIDSLIKNNISGNINVKIGEVLALVNNVLSYVESIIFLSLILSITYFCYEYRRIKENRLLFGSFNVIILIKALGAFCSACTSIIISMIQIFTLTHPGVIRNEYIVHELEQYHLYATYAANFAEFAALFLIIAALIKDKTLARGNIAALCVLALLFGVMAFLSTQLRSTEFMQARMLFSTVVYVYCAVTLAFLGRKKITAIDK